MYGHTGIGVVLINSSAKWCSRPAQLNNRVFAFKYTGFSLVELLLTLVVIGIVMSFASVAYTHYIKRANDAYGKTMLLEVLAQQNKFFLKRRYYSLSFQALGYANEQVRSQKQLFTLSLSPCGAESVYKCIQINAESTSAQTTGINYSINTYGDKFPAESW